MKVWFRKNKNSAWREAELVEDQTPFRKTGALVKIRIEDEEPFWVDKRYVWRRPHNALEEFSEVKDGKQCVLGRRLN